MTFELAEKLGDLKGTASAVRYRVENTLGSGPCAVCTKNLLRKLKMTHYQI
jgi:hypothetical protein